MIALQRGEKTEVRQCFSDLHYIVAAIENLACLVESGVVTASLAIVEDAEDTLYLNTCKYVHRLAYAVQVAHVTMKNTITDDEFHSIQILCDRRTDLRIEQDEVYREYRTVLSASVAKVIRELLP